MAKSSKRSIPELSTSSTDDTFPNVDENNDPLALQRKIAIATEEFTTHKFCELILTDRSRISKENALTICDYVIAMKREINPRLSYKKYTIQFCMSYQKLLE